MLCLLKISLMSPSLQLFLSFNRDTYLPVAASNATTAVRTDEPAKEIVDARGILDAIRKSVGVYEHFLPAIKQPNPTKVRAQPVTGGAPAPQSVQQIAKSCYFQLRSVLLAWVNPYQGGRMLRQGQPESPQ